MAELSRLTNSVPELGRLLEWSSLNDVRLIAAARGFDSEEDGGRLAVPTIIEISQWEHERLLTRTRKGPPSVADYPERRARIAGMRADGMTLQAIDPRPRSRDGGLRPELSDRAGEPSEAVWEHEEELYRERESQPARDRPDKPTNGSRLRIGSRTENRTERTSSEDALESPDPGVAL